MQIIASDLIKGHTYVETGHKRWKYTLKRGVVFNLPRGVISGFYFHPHFIIANNSVIIKEGYSWDGATCFPDFDWIMRGSLVHDVLYQYMNISLSEHPEKDLIVSRDDMDQVLEQMCMNDGAPLLMPAIVYTGVRIGYPLSVLFGWPK